MPIKSAFRRSILNSQPIPPAPLRQTPTSMTDSVALSDSLIATFDGGFATAITRQDSVTSDSADAIPLVRGIKDSNLATSVSSDPERPELLSLTGHFKEPVESIDEILALRDFEASIDEADLSLFYEKMLVGQQAQKISKRADAANAARSETEGNVLSLSRMTNAIDTFRDSCGFISNQDRIHKGSKKFLEALPLVYGENPTDQNLTIQRTLTGLSDITTSCNTSLVTLLAYSLLYPGSVKFEKPEVGDKKLQAFAVPVVTSDPVNQLLAAISVIDPSTPEGFLEAESLLPQDPTARIALIAEALAYELSISAGMSRLEIASLATYIKETVGSTTSAINGQPPAGTLLSAFRDGQNLPLEINDTSINGSDYKGILTAYVDGPVGSGSLDFTALENAVKAVTQSLGKLLEDTGKIRCLDEASESLTAANIIAEMAAAVCEGTSTLGLSVDTARSSLQIAQLLLFKEIATTASTGAILEARFRTFSSLITTSSETVQTETSASASSDTKTASTSKSESSKTSNQQSSKSLKVTVDGAVTNVKVEDTTESKVQAMSPGRVAPSTLSSLTTSGSKLSSSRSAGIGNARGTSSGKSAGTAEQTASKNQTSSKTSSGSSSGTSTVESVQENSDLESLIYKTFTGKGGSGHITANYNSSFEITGEELIVSQQSSVKNDEFTRAGLTFSSMGILGSKDLLRRFLMGDNIDVISVVSQAANTVTSPTPPPTAKEAPASSNRTKKSPHGILSMLEKYTSSGKTTATGLPGVSSPISKRSSPTSGIKSRTSKWQSNANSVTYAASTASPRLENILGIRSNSTNLTPAKESSNVPKKYAVGKITIKEDDNDVIEIVGNVSKQAAQTFRGRDLVARQAVPSEQAANVSPEYTAFLELFPALSQSESQTSFKFAMQSLRDSLKNESDAGQSLLSGEFRKVVDTIFSNTSNIAGKPGLVDSSTLNYSLSRQTIEFLCFSMFSSMCSFMPSVTGTSITSAGRSDFDVSIDYDRSAMLRLWNSMNGVAEHKGKISELPQKVTDSPEFSLLINCMRYANKVTETLKIRYAVMQNFVSTYSTSTSTLVSTMKDPSLLELVTKLRKSGQESILQEITQETVSYAQLSLAMIRGPLSLDRTSRMTRIAKNITSLLHRNFSVQESSDSLVACVGLPAKTIEFLRRSQPSAGIKTGLSEYIEITFSKQDIQFPDLVLRNTVFRFCPRLEVVPNFTSYTNIRDAMRDFLYLCHDGSGWVTKDVNEAITFVSEVTGLERISAYVIVVNHAIDAICRIASYASGTAGLYEMSNPQGSSVMSTAGAELALEEMRNNSVMKVAMGNLLPGNFMQQVPGGYRFMRFSELDGRAAVATDQSRHRLLGSILSDPIFTYENGYTVSRCFTPFERVYNCVIDPDEFMIDKSRTQSTVSGRTAYDKVVADGLVDVYSDVAVFRDTSSNSLFDGSAYAVKVELITE